MRGERKDPEAFSAGVRGSSPHARGTLKPAIVSMLSIRFIPACAGNANHDHHWYGRVAVHPRMRGERFAGRFLQHDHFGSSPHARGTRGDRSILHVSTAVHPRMRGERSRAATFQQPANGSSPHARGTLPHAVPRWGQRRFIPACAGNASMATHPVTATKVHPRMRGERAIPGVSAIWTAGSSPHARGTRVLIQHDSEIQRFIPACAGNARRIRRRSGH